MLDLANVFFFEKSNCAVGRGVAQPGLERFLGVEEVGGSNPVAPTIMSTQLTERSERKLLCELCP